MEALIENLNSFEVTHHPNNPNAEHPRYSLYKAKTRNSCQEERRRKILAQRKEARYDLLSYLREIDEHSKDPNAISDDDMEAENPQKVYAKPRRFCNFILQSEWLVDVPENFADSYFSLPCPVGRRCLVVTNNGYTNAYSKNGYSFKSFRSSLPGGFRTPYGRKRGTTILDCIYCESLKIFYIIDMVCWNNMSYLDCDTSFRFTWLKVTLEEYDLDVSKESKWNPFRFQLLPFCKSDSESLENMLQNKTDFEVPVDGILFYHKDTHYTHGPSPLVCWLKVFMIPEILNVQLPKKYCNERPSNYTNIGDHIRDYEIERKTLVETGKKEKHLGRKKAEGKIDWENMPSVSMNDSTTDESRVEKSDDVPWEREA